MKYLLLITSLLSVLHTNAQTDTAASSHTIFNYVDHMPEPAYNYNQYLQNNLHYPDSARLKDIEGRVTIKFTVAEDGSINDCHIIRGIGGGCDEEALRVIKAMPPWRPGTSNGAPVKVNFTLPINFKLFHDTDTAPGSSKTPTDKNAPHEVAPAHVQSYTDSMQRWQTSYKERLMSGSHPLPPGDTAYVSFFPIDEHYRVTATFEQVTGTRPFLLGNMHGGTRRAVREYGYVYFKIMGAAITLTVYRFANMDNNVVNGGLFIPFTDRTNYNETFLGGRYLDVNIDSIIDNRVVLDFNRAYNPHTAYEKGYPYMICPSNNSLRIEMKAGEKIFGKNPGY